MNRELSILTLGTHRDKLLAASSWEEYRTAHVEYIQFLIDKYTSELATEKVVMTYVVGEDDASSSPKTEG